MLRTERESAVYFSQASLPPALAIFSSSDNLNLFVEGTGSEGLEVLPTWGIVFEVIREGKLRMDDLPRSFHASWWDDFQAEKRWGNPTRKTEYLIRPLFFPPPLVTNPVMRRLQSDYPDLSTTFHCLEKDGPYYHDEERVLYLELAHQNAIDAAWASFWVARRPEKRGLVLSTRDDQIREWAKRYCQGKVDEGWEETAESLLWPEHHGWWRDSNVKGVHLGPLPNREVRGLVNDFGPTLTEKRLQLLYETGFVGQAVIEVDPRQVARVAKQCAEKPVWVYKLMVERFKKIRDRFAEK